MKWLPGSETREAILKHPFMLAGGAVVALLGLTAGVLVVVDAARGSSAAPEVLIEDVTTTTPGPVAKTAVSLGVIGKTKTTVAVRSSPGERTPVLGTLQKNSEVQIDGRTEDARWLRVVFPINSEGHGWIDASQLTITGDPASLVVATAEPAPLVEVPTRAVARITPEPSERSAPPAQTRRPPTAVPLPDLVVSTTPTIVNGKLFISVINQGTGTMSGALVVALFTADGSALLGGATVGGVTLAPGQSIDVGTGYEIPGVQGLLVIVDPNGDVDELDNTNNRVTFVVSPPATPVPPPPPPPTPTTPPH